MTQERIDLTEDGLRKHIIKYAEEHIYPTSDLDMGDVENILHCIDHTALIAELKRCYEELDRKNKRLEELDRCQTVCQYFDEECRRCGGGKYTKYYKASE